MAIEIIEIMEMNMQEKTRLELRRIFFFVRIKLINPKRAINIRVVNPKGIKTNAIGKI